MPQSLAYLCTAWGVGKLTLIGVCCEEAVIQRETALQRFAVRVSEGVSMKTHHRLQAVHPG